MRLNDGDRAESAMLGPPKPRRLDQPIAVSLEDLIPQDHFYRHLEAKLDTCWKRAPFLLPNSWANHGTRLIELRSRRAGLC